MSILTKTPITNNPVFDFVIKDNYIQLDDTQVYGIRLFIPSLAIKTDEEIENEILKFQRLLETLEENINRLYNKELIFFCTDKEENLEGNKTFWKSLNPKYYPYTSDIIEAIENKEVTSLSVQKACYIFIKTNDRDLVYSICQTIDSLNYVAHITDKNELSVLLRNFILREFTNKDIYTLENSLSIEYDNLLPKKQKKQTKEQFFKSELSKSLTPINVRYSQRNAQQNDFLRKVIMIKNIPSDDKACRFTKLAQMKNTSFCMRITPMNKHLIAKLVNNQTNNKKVKSGSKKRTDQIDAKTEMNEIDEFYTECSNRAIYYTNIFVECYGKTQKALEDNLIDIKSKLLNITYEHLNYMQKEAFQSLHPFGNDNFSNMCNNIPVSSLARFYPFSYSSRNDEKGCVLGYTSDGGNFVVDFLNWGNDITNGNFSILGNSGQGKSYLAKKIASQLIFRGSDFYFLDPENEYVEMVQQLGGSIIDPTDGDTIINPFEIRKQRDNTKEKEDDKDVKTSLFANKSTAFFQHLAWLTQFLRLTHHIDETNLNVLMALVQDVYKLKGIDENTNIDNLSPTDYPTYTDVYKYIEKCAKENPEQYQHIYVLENYRQILIAIQSAYNGSLSLQLNGYTNIKNDRIICFAIRDLLSTGEQKSMIAILFNIITYVWNKIVSSNNFTTFIIDELASLMIEDVMKYIKDISKRIRKYNGLLGTLTQNLLDIVQSDCSYLASAVFSQSTFRFIFYPGLIDILTVQKFLNLSDGEIGKIKFSHRQHCLAIIGSQTYYLTIGTLPFEEKLFGKAGGR